MPHNPPQPGEMPPHEQHDHQSQHIHERYAGWYFRRFPVAAHSQLQQLAVLIGVNRGHDARMLMRIHSFTPNNGTQGVSISAPLWVGFAAEAAQLYENTCAHDHQHAHTHGCYPPNMHHDTTCASNIPPHSPNIINLTGIILAELPVAWRKLDNVLAIVNIVERVLASYRTTDGRPLLYGLNIELPAICSDV